MSNKRYSDTINPQIAVQDYLDDLLQKLPSSSPLDELRHEEEKAAAAVAKKKAQEKTEKPVEKTAPRPRYHSTYGAVSSNYSAERETSLAAQRLEKKRALGRVSQRGFREPLNIPPSPLLKVMPEIQTPAVEMATELEETNAKLSDAVEVSTTDSVEHQTEPMCDLESTSTAVDTSSALDRKVIEQPRAPNPVEVDNRALLQPTASPARELPEPNLVEEKATTTENAEAYTNKWLENGRPEWAQGRFECLIFTVAGLKLAVPLVSLGAIHTIDQELTPLVGRPDWFLGLLPVGEKNIRVVDSALWIMPERYHEAVKDGYRFVIRLDNSEWGMACDSVAQSFSISPEEVRWRTDRGKRPWLAGTVIDHMCALMDVAAVAHLLDTAEKTNQSPI